MGLISAAVSTAPQTAPMLLCRPMMSTEYDQPVLLLGNAQVCAKQRDWIDQWTGPIVCADGGTRHLSGRQPDRVIGDLDSIKSSERDRLPIQLWHDQNLNDFEKVLRSVSAPRLIGLGFLGQRWDHSLANLMIQARLDRHVELWDAHNRILAVHSLRFSVVCQRNKTVGIIPVTRCRFESSRGLKFPLDGLEMDPLGLVAPATNQPQRK